MGREHVRHRTVERNRQRRQHHCRSGTWCRRATCPPPTALQRRDGYAYAVSLFSFKRMSAFEYGNGENYKGWWTGMGMTYLYNGDLTQYGGNYWATIDMGRLAGTTTDHSGSGEPVAWKFYGNTKNTVGGAELN
jgi:hyaluronate lyase